MFRKIISILLGIFLVVIVGSVILDTFPQLQPLWEEFKQIVVMAYDSSTVKYGTLTTAALIVALLVVFGTSKY